MTKRAPRPYRVYIVLPNGRKTKGRYYNKAKNAWMRRRRLLANLSERYVVCIYNVPRKFLSSSCRGYGKCADHGMGYRGCMMPMYAKA